MKKLFMVGLIVLMAVTIISAKHYKPMFGGGLGFDFVNTSSEGYSDSDFGFQMTAEGMAPIYKSLYARASLLALRAGDATTFSFGTGSSFDLMYFLNAMNNGIEPYGVGGLRLYTTSSGGYSSTTFGFALGGGAQMTLKTAPVKPYGELQIGIGTTSSSGSSITEFDFSMMFGIRFGGK